MKALVYKAVGEVKLEERPKPKITHPGDAIVKLTKSTICGTDLHITQGDVATCTPGRILGHEGVGIVEETGVSVSGFKKGERVLISCICSCATCEYCRRGMYSHCTTGGWILGNTIDGTQAEYVRIPHADSSLYPIPPGADEAALVMLSDIFPTGLECGVINSKIQPGSTVVVIGTGPVGLASIITAQLYSPSLIIAIDTDPNRLTVAKQMGAHHAINSASEKNVEEVVKKLTDGKGCDAVIEAVGIPATFELCQALVAPGGVIANVGVHGGKVDLHLENLWDKNIAITTRLVDAVTTPMLLRLAVSGKLDPSKLITHKFPFSDMEKAYGTFRAAAKHQALKVLIEFDK
ncbi:Alcohol dehydrogenase GroES-containing protein [Venustampulla echinocandica]|uniref:Alcohol dehydrogenase GroES-containing protein n=1 Tax=Venustampulla echinocandica TaxID=2656787 RepID=A0A370U1M4_9HELO|nr:Alcohol dehydrogenase GroES-containing protein [Venustampulla echinocandica]RDL41682.1 Alcohol dehydrogenase GroES-containing protein [Venustampulla echinocandica]